MFAKFENSAVIQRKKRFAEYKAKPQIVRARSTKNFDKVENLENTAKNTIKDNEVPLLDNLLL